jgi:uncharacterized protein involved in response to NO
VNVPYFSRWKVLTAAPHRLMFLTGMAALLVASAWWGMHLLARSTGWPLFALDLKVAPIWAHTFLMLFTVFPTFFFGFLFTVFPRWMNGPLVPRRVYVTTGLLMAAATAAWLAGIHGAPGLQIVAGLLALGGLLAATSALIRVLLDAKQSVPHAYVVLTGLCVEIVALAGFAFGIATASDFALHFAVRTALWGGLLPVFFAVCHRMIPFFSQNAVPHYVAWRPQWILIAVVALAYARLLLGTAGALRTLVIVDVALFALTALCAVRWTSLQAKGNPLAWTLYAGFAWLPVATLLQAARDLGFVATGQWLLGRAPIHALGMGFFGGMLIAMVTRVTMGHSGRPLRMDRIALACFFSLQAATVARVASEVVTAPGWVQALLLASVALWLAAFGVWTWRLGGIYLAPRIDGQPG